MSALKRFAQPLGVTTDELIFDEHERGPDYELRLQFAAVARFGPEEEKAAKDLVYALILKHQAERWTGTGQQRRGEEKKPGPRAGLRQPPTNQPSLGRLRRRLEPIDDRL